MFNLRLPFTWMLISIVFIASAQQVVEDSISLGPGYSNQVYYAFGNGEVLSSSATNWDIAFRAGTFTSSIRINGGQGVRLYQLPGDTSAFSTTTDTIGLANYNVLYNADTTWEYGAFERNPSGQFNYGWGEYNTTTHIVSGTRAFLVEAVDGSFKKIVIEALNRGTWKFRYADVDGSNLKTDSVVVSDYNDKIYIGYSLVDQQVRDFEPILNQWDLVFTKFVTEDYNGTPYQEVTGVLANLDVPLAEARNMAADDADVDNYTLTSDNIMTIGWDWKSLNFQTFQWELADSLSYFIKAQNDNIYQVWITDFAGSSSGNVNLSYRQVGTVSGIGATGNIALEYKLYPNPNNGHFNIVYNNNNQTEMYFELYNLSGQLLYQQQLPQAIGLHTQAINMSSYDLPAGIYQTILRGNEVIARDKIIITQ